jgi:hypothetical protein
MTNSIRHRADILQDRQGHKLASYLTLSANELPHHVSERLRVSRSQALSKRKLAKPGFAYASTASGNALTWGGDDSLGWLGRIGSVLPLLALEGLEGKLFAPVAVTIVLALAASLLLALTLMRALREEVLRAAVMHWYGW